MSEQRNGERIWDIMERVGVCMLTTQSAGRLRARPLEARPDRKAGLIFAVTDVHSAKQDEIEAAPDVGLVVIDAKAKAYLSITARACVMRDSALGAIASVSLNWASAAASLTRHRPGQKSAAVGTPAAPNWFLGYESRRVLNRNWA